LIWDISISGVKIFYLLNNLAQFTMLEFANAVVSLNLKRFSYSLFWLGKHLICFESNVSTATKATRRDVWAKSDLAPPATVKNPEGNGEAENLNWQKERKASTLGASAEWKRIIPIFHPAHGVIWSKW
jgi:hypothetical protein